MTHRPCDHLETERLFLRRSVDGDAEVIYTTYATDVEVTRFLTWQPHGDISETRAFLNYCHEIWERGSAFPYVIIRKEDSTLLGMIEVRISGHRAEIGYVLARPFWGEGYMTEALRALIRWTVAQQGIQRVWAFCDVENHASRRVLEKAGMEREGLVHRWIMAPNLNHEPRDCYFYCLPHCPDAIR